MRNPRRPFYLLLLKSVVLGVVWTLVIYAYRC